MFGYFVIAVCLILIVFLVDLLLHPDRDLEKEMKEHPLNGVYVNLEDEEEEGWL